MNTTLLTDFAKPLAVRNGRYSHQAQLSPTLAGFAPIHLAEMNHVRLMERIDTKYLLHESQLVAVLAALTPYYRVLDIAYCRLNRYRTIYFDTANFILYHRHHAGARQRYKVRSRQYVDSGISFLEIKQKVDQQRTIKNRLQTDNLMTSFTSEAEIFLADYFPRDVAQLAPKLWNEYLRVTLVSKQHQERVTVDVDLSFGGNGRIITLPGVAIAEIKQADHCTPSIFKQQMQTQHIRPLGLSKYCLGVVMLYEGIKYNNFKPKIRQIHQLIRGN